MENKIQELTDKIYREGVEKGNEEAQRLVEEAQKKAAQIVAEAQKEAEALKAAAQKSATEMKENATSELKLFAGQSVNALKTEIANLISDKVVSSSVKDLTSSKDFLNNFMLEMARKWATSEPVVISTSQAEELKKFFAAKAKDLLDKGVKIEQVNGQDALFSISPADGAYKVNFGEEEFENYFKSFLRPQLVEMLF